MRWVFPSSPSPVFNHDVVALVLALALYFGYARRRRIQQANLAYVNQQQYNANQSYPQGQGGYAPQYPPQTPYGQQSPFAQNGYDNGQLYAPVCFVTLLSAKSQALTLVRSASWTSASGPRCPFFTPAARLLRATCGSSAYQRNVQGSLRCVGLESHATFSPDTPLHVVVLLCFIFIRSPVYYPPSAIV